MVLSPAFFSKAWTQRELQGLAAREVDAGTKGTLPVWHNVDRRYILHRSPTLADRLGALTCAGIDDVADKISAALTRADSFPAVGGRTDPLVQSVNVDGSENPVLRFDVAMTDGDWARLVSERPDFWEYRLFAGLLAQGKADLESKWHDHEMRLPRGPRQELDAASAPDFVAREMSWLITQIRPIDRLLSPSVMSLAFGAPGEHGDPARIEHVARRLLEIYEGLLDWAASVRNIPATPSVTVYLEATAHVVDQPLREMREFVARRSTGFHGYHS